MDDIHGVCSEPFGPAQRYHFWGEVGTDNFPAMFLEEETIFTSSGTDFEEIQLFRALRLVLK